jgi:hypothetical protein
MAKFRTAFKEVMDAPVVSSAEVHDPTPHLSDVRTGRTWG